MKLFGIKGDKTKTGFLRNHRGKLSSEQITIFSKNYDDAKKEIERGTYEYVAKQVSHVEIFLGEYVKGNFGENPGKQAGIIGASLGIIKGIKGFNSQETKNLASYRELLTKITDVISAAEEILKVKF